MRGGRDSNGNEYAMNMMKLSDADGSPDEPPTPEVIALPPDEALYADSEEAIQRQEAIWREEAEFDRISHLRAQIDDEEGDHRDYGYGHSDMTCTQPTPPLPRSAPYVEPAHRVDGYRGYTYDFLATAYVLPERSPRPSRARAEVGR